MFLILVICQVYPLQRYVSMVVIQQLGYLVFHDGNTPIELSLL